MWSENVFKELGCWLGFKLSFHVPKTAMSTVFGYKLTSAQSYKKVRPSEASEAKLVAELAARNLLLTYNYL